MKTSDFLKLLKKHPIFIENEVMIDEAIKELEELEIRNCKGCKHYGEYEYEICGAEDFTRIVKGCTLMLKIFEDGFCCNKWEAKNENL